MLTPQASDVRVDHGYFRENKPVSCMQRDDRLATHLNNLAFLPNIGCTVHMILTVQAPMYTQLQALLQLYNLTEDVWRQCEQLIYSG